MTGAEIVFLVVGTVAKLTQIGLEAAATTQAERADLLKRYKDAIAEANDAAANLSLRLAEHDAEADMELSNKFKPVP